MKINKTIIKYSPTYEVWKTGMGENISLGYFSRKDAKQYAKNCTKNAKKGEFYYVKEMALVFYEYRKVSNEKQN